MKKYVLFLLLLAILEGSASKVKAACIAGEINAIYAHKDDNCEAVGTHHNLVRINVDRNWIKTGTFKWRWRSDSLHAWQVLPGIWGFDSISGSINTGDFYYQYNGDFRVVFTETGTNCRDTLILRVEVNRAPLASVSYVDKCYGALFTAKDSRNASGIGNTYEWNGDPSLIGKTYKISCFNCGIWLSVSTSVVIKNAAGCTSEAFTGMIVNNAVENSITSTKDTLTINDTCLLTASSSYQMASVNWYKGGVLVGSGPDYVVQYAATGKYKARIHNTPASGGCTRDQFITIYKKSGLRIVEPDPYSYNAELTVYPNPATDQITIGGHSQLIEIFNLQGACVRTISTEEVNPTISISDLPAGIYVVKSGGEVVRFGK